MSDALSDIVRRLEDLEVRYAFQQDHIQQLDEVVREQADRIVALRHELETVREQLKNLPDDEAPPEEQVPPHY